MPAPETSPCPTSALGHVNLMLDTFIANASVDDLRAITRNLLATQPNALTQCYKTCAQARLRQSDNASIPDPASLFEKLDENSFAPTPSFTETLSRARKLYGVGLGTSSLPLLTSIVQATVGLRWKEVGDVADLLAVVDSDISQAIQSTKEEIASGRIRDISIVREAAEKLRKAVKESERDVQLWGGEFPFGRADISISFWKL